MSSRRALGAFATILNTASIVLLIVWAVGYFGYNSSNLIHLLLLFALITFLIRLIISS